VSVWRHEPPEPPRDSPALARFLAVLVVFALFGAAGSVVAILLISVLYPLGGR